MKEVIELLNEQGFTYVDANDQNEETFIKDRCIKPNEKGFFRVEVRVSPSKITVRSTACERDFTLIIFTGSFHTKDQLIAYVKKELEMYLGPFHNSLFPVLNNN